MPHAPEPTLLVTADGSPTLRHARVDEPYHSVYGAVTESTHVFIRAGLEARGLPDADVLEVGLGTGLNMLLTWVHCLERGRTVRYTALEPFPLEAATLERLAHCAAIAWPGLHAPFIRAMTAPPGNAQVLEGGLTFTRLAAMVQTFRAEEAFDVVYFDAFAPDKQPDMWTEEVFRGMHRALRPGGTLVTYCAKGAVRRAMQAAGLVVERLPGPPGKREMLRAARPA
ncbi:MAG: tRNA (5-methylaminomethyl-2-thiouridine)(34)-methyltransferase MnmD [Flavobacteriales bacterium]|jgi:tRNA U34 5-methylaminomethyl-2-thiouridine-forming methyltransferase MnmC|nr:tRNA (5-methylaminomethyl-2-thiouridine)(34)-methyltransferase MnmD [Flavobacteriales bacterium]